MVQTKSSNVLLLLIVAGLMLAIGMTLKDIPLTKHAMESHKEQIFYSESIQKFMTKQNGCKLFAQWCSDETFRITCKINMEKNRCVGLVVACNPLQIVTGFEGRCNYWQSMREGCTIPVPVPQNFMFLQ